VLQTIIDDPVLQDANTRIIAEPWSLYGTFVGSFPASTTRGGVGWFEWNGRFRDWWRSWVNFDGTNGDISYCALNTTCTTPYWTMHSQEGGRDGGFLMTGSYDWYHGNQRRPYHSVNFITVHDGFTMYDAVSYSRQRNGCGPLNPVCCDSPASAFCDPLSGEGNNRSRSWSDEGFKAQQMRNLFAGMIVAQGTPMILGGDEWMRTQLGNNNAYTTGADNPFNWYDWGSWQANPARVRMHDFVAKLLRFRKEHAYAFALADYGQGAPFSWKSETGGDANFDTKHIAQHYYDGTKGPQLYIMMNMEAGNVSFKLPTGVTWKRLFDTQAYFEGSDPGLSGNITLDVPAVVETASYGVQSHSVVVLQAAQ
jgi:glycogen operon protein